MQKLQTWSNTISSLSRVYSHTTEYSNSFSFGYIPHTLETRLRLEVANYVILWDKFSSIPVCVNKILLEDILPLGNKFCMATFIVQQYGWVRMMANLFSTDHKNIYYMALNFKKQNSSGHHSQHPLSFNGHKKCNGFQNVTKRQ